MQNTIICRLGYCEKCAKHHRPKTGQVFVAYGSTRNDFVIKHAVRSGVEGFVPHLYELNKVIGNSVMVTKTCSLHECGVSAKVDKDGGGTFTFQNCEKETMSIDQWNGLVSLHHEFTKDYEI